MGVAPEITLQSMVRGMSLNHAVSLYPNSQRMLPQTPKLGAKPIAHDAVNYKCSVDLAWSGEDFSTRQVPPFVGTDDPAGLHPAIIRIQVSNQIGSCRRLGPDLFRPPHQFHHLDADAIHLEKVRPHPLQHNLPIDIHHVGVAYLAPIHDVRHLHARTQFIRLRLHRKDADLAALEILNDFLWKIAKRSRRQVLQHPCAIVSPHRFQFADHAGRDFFGSLVGYDRNLLAGLDAQTNPYRVAGSGSEFRVERNRIKLPVGLTDRNVHHPTFLAEAVTDDSVNPTSVSSMM